MTTRQVILLTSALVALSTLPTHSAYANSPGNPGKSGSTSSSLSLPAFSGPKKKLTVVPFDNQASQTGATPVTQGAYMPGSQSTGQQSNIQPPPDFGAGIARMVTSELSKSGRFYLPQNDNAGAASGQISSSTTASNQTGAQVLIKGSVTEYTYSTSQTSTNQMVEGVNNVQNQVNSVQSSVGDVQNSVGNAIGNLFGHHHASSNPIPSTSVGMGSPDVGLGYTNCKAKVGLEIRIVDVSTGHTIDTVDVDGDASAGSMTANIANAQMGSSGFNSGPLGQAVSQAVDNAVYQICTDQGLSTLPWEAQIADTDSDGGKVTTLYLDAGSNSGVKEGDEFTVLKPGRAIMSPGTQIVLGRTKDTIIGHCHVDSVSGDLATASVLDGSGFAVGQRIRYASDVAAAP